VFINDAIVGSRADADTPSDGDARLKDPDVEVSSRDTSELEDTTLVLVLLDVEYGSEMKAWLVGEMGITVTLLVRLYEPELVENMVVVVAASSGPGNRGRVYFERRGPRWRGGRYCIIRYGVC